MPTLRQKVDSFCKDAGAKVESTDKLRAQITQLKDELKKSKETFKNHMKQMKAASKVPKAPKTPKPKTRKLTEEEKGQQKREKAVTKELAKAAAPKQVVAMNPLPPSPVVASAGRRTRRRY